MPFQVSTANLYSYQRSRENVKNLHALIDNNVNNVAFNLNSKLKMLALVFVTRCEMRTRQFFFSSWEREREREFLFFFDSSIVGGGKIWTLDVFVRNTKIEFLDDHPHSKYLVISWMWVNINMVSYACQLM